MAQSNKQTKALGRSRFSKGGLIVFVLLFGAIGAVAILKSQAATLTTGTVSFNGVSNINSLLGSGGYSVVNDQVGSAIEQVALVSVGGSLSYGGKGGGTTAAPTSAQYCYIMRVKPGTSASVQLLGTNGGIVTRTVKGWPYTSTPIPYQYTCVTTGTLVQKSVPNFRVLSGSEVYIYGVEARAAYPY